MIPKYRLMMVRDGSLRIRKAKLTAPEEAYALLKPHLKDLDREHFVVVALNSKMAPVGINSVSIGAVDAAIVHPREVYKFAILSNATAILLGHNHPSGDPMPSSDDITLSKRLVEAGKILGIEVIDHIIIGHENYYSMKRQNLL